MRLLTVAVVLSGLAMAACSAGRVESGSARPVPAASASGMPDSYRYVLESSCGERALLGRYRVVVRDGAVTSVLNLNDDYPYQPDLADVPTLSSLLEMPDRAGPQAVVDLELDPEGLPRSLSIDHVPDAIDDEECYEVEGVTVLD